MGFAIPEGFKVPHVAPMYDVPEPKGADIRCLCRLCHGTAFFLKVIMTYGDHFISSNVVKNDGTQPEPGDKLVCGSCGSVFDKGLQVDSEVSQCRES